MIEQIKKYIVIDHENDDAFIYYGTLEEIHTHLENEWIDIHNRVKSDETGYQELRYTEFKIKDR